MQVNSRRPLVIDLFGGAGGLGEGLQQAGFDVRVAVDFDRHAAATYAANHPNTKVVVKDVAKVTGEELQRLAGSDEIDLIAGGPSCQGFSTHGKRIQDDPRNFLYTHFVRLVNEVRPKFFLMENVRGLLTYSKGYFRALIEQSFEEIGYKVAFTSVCAADFGVPQLRHRVLFIGTRIENVKLTFPRPTHGENVEGLLPYVTVGEALGDLPLLGKDFRNPLRQYASKPQNDYQRYARKGALGGVTLHLSAPLSPQAGALAKFIKQGQGLRAVPVAHLPERFTRMRTISNGQLRNDCTTLYHRLSPARPSYTITCYYRNVASGPFLNPWEDRSLSHREAARLMSFPDTYEFKGSMITRQIGNAVPPLMGKAIGQHLMRLMKRAAGQHLRLVA